MPTSTKKKSKKTATKAPASAKRSVAGLAQAADAARAARGGRTGAVDRAERRAWGRALREEVPRAVHGDWEPATDRPDPVAVLVAQGEN